MRLPAFFRRSRGTGARPDHAPRDFDGFTIIEVMTVAVVMSTLVRIALPNFHEVLLMTRAAEVVGHFETVRVAALNYYAEHYEWPDDAYVGQIPEGLAEFLPDNYNFNRAGYRLDWENWVLPNGLPTHPETGVLVGISVSTEDSELGYAVVDLLGGIMAYYTLGTNYTFVMERM